METCGGSAGVRDEASLLAAIEHAWQATFGREHFASPFEKAAALMASIIRRRPFFDGTKRTGTASACYLLSTLGYDVETEQRAVENFAVSVAESDLTTEEIALRFEEHGRRA